MPVLKLTQTIDRPVEQVFATVIDVANFPRWNPTTKSARQLSPGEVGEGTRFELEIRDSAWFPRSLRNSSVTSASSWCRR